ncbi:MAG: IS66 family transposase [Opitutales bacterium]
MGARHHAEQRAVDLARENIELRGQLAEAHARIAELSLQVARLSEQVARGNERLAELLAIAQRKQRPTSKPAPEPRAPAHLSAEEKARFENRPKPPAPRPREKKSKKPVKPTGRKPVPEHLEAEEHTVAPSACPCGSTELDLVDEVVEIKLDVVKEHQRRRVVKRKTGCCRRCGERTTARSLPAPFARSKATCEWLAWLVHMHCVLLVPLDRIRRDLVARGISVAMSYLVTQLERASDLLGPIDGEHWKRLLQSDWMATDATGLKVLVPKVPGSHNGYIEAFRNDSMVVFQYEPDKGAEMLAAKLAAFEGVLVADAEHRHNAVFASGAVLEAGCNAHGRRKLRDAESVQPALAKEAGAFIAAIYDTEAAAKEKGLEGRALRTWRRQKVRPLQKKLLAWMNATEPSLTPDDDLAKAIRYYRNHWQALFRFVDHPEIPIDNSATEREFQSFAKLRHNRLFAGSTEGAHRMATLLGIAATCRAVGVDPQAYLAWAFTRLGTHRDVFGLTAAEMTPAAFKQTLAS